MQSPQLASLAFGSPEAGVQGRPKVDVSSPVQGDVYEQALHEHARELGFDLEYEPEYKWIAEESLVAPLNDGWTQIKQEHGDFSGSLYYYNEISGESQWEVFILIG